MCSLLNDDQSALGSKAVQKVGLGYYVRHIAEALDLSRQNQVAVTDDGSGSVLGVIGSSETPQFQDMVDEALRSDPELLDLDDEQPINGWLD